MARQTTRRLSRPQDVFNNPPDYPENFYTDPAANGSNNVVFVTNFDLSASRISPDREHHWRRDENGQVYTTYESGIVEVPSDAGSDYMDKMRPPSLPSNMSPPPPPIVQTKNLPSAPSSIGFSARASQVGTPPPKTTSSGSVRNIPITQPPGFWVPHLRAGSPSNVNQLHDLLSDTRRFQTSPDSYKLPQIPQFEQPIPSPSESIPHLRTFSPFRTHSASGTRHGSLPNHPTFRFKPQSTSSPPPSHTIGSNRSPEPSDRPRPSHPSTDLPPQAQAPWISSTEPLRRPFPASQTQKTDSVPVNLPDLNNFSRGWTSPEGFQLFPPARPVPAQRQPDTAFPVFFEQYPSGYVPYTEGNERGDYSTTGNDPRVDPVQEKHPPRRPSRSPLAPAQQYHPSRMRSPISSPPLPPPRRESPEPGPFGLLQKCANAIETALTEDWDKLHTYLGAMTDLDLRQYATPHRQTSESLRRLLHKVLTFVNEAIASRELMEVGTVRWQASWQKQLSSLDRTTTAFTKFSNTICARTASYRILDKLLPKFKQYVVKLRDLAKKIYMLQNRLKVRQAHAALAQAHAEAKEQLRSARSRRDLPRWDEDKRRRRRLREDYLAIRNHIAIGTSRLSWAQSES
ncbi:hypothetical protein H0H92_003366 [Tricholoma furcatifolium]|nr:hypothetical protein H0H92_003366 [Tricholoma furcatifolium]